MGAGQLAVLPTSLALGSVKIGASQTQSATLINSGSSDLTVRQATVTGKGFRMSGLTFPLTLAAGQRKSFTVTFAPQSAGNSSGSIAVTTDAANPVVSVPVSAVATAPGALISNPSSLGFGSVQVGNGQTLVGHTHQLWRLQRDRVSGQCFRIRFHRQRLEPAHDSGGGPKRGLQRNF